MMKVGVDGDQIVKQLSDVKYWNIVFYTSQTEGISPDNGSSQ